jgi:hypothetical protein
MKTVSCKAIMLCYKEEPRHHVLAGDISIYFMPMMNEGSVLLYTLQVIELSIRFIAYH